jgi:nicotinamidase-related amidase
MPHPAQISAADTAVLLIDVQAKLVPKILDAERLVGNLAFLLDIARVAEVPVLATEQYPRGLGETVPELAQRLGARPEKLKFSGCAAPTVVDTLQRQGRPKVVLCGIETHVCVLHTALDLLALDFRVFLTVDAVGSRYRIDHDTALRRMEQAGAVPTTVETCAFELLGGADHPRFKDVSKLVQERMKTL